MDALLVVNAIRCRYDHQAVVDQLSFQLAHGEIASLLGPSGCGKTTVLRSIAGFHPVDDGAIALEGQILSSPDRMVPPEQRQIGMVFQDYALFPHLDVRANVTFGLRRHSTRERERLCDEMLELVQLRDLADRYPHELSGGQQQRVALARALAPSPRLLLLDEPFSNLDVDLRRELSLEVREILKSRRISALLVTHDQEEAFAVADNIGVVHQGRIQQWDSPYNLYHQPINRFVADFVGQGVFLPGQVANANSFTTELGLISGDTDVDWPSYTPVDILLRPDDIVPDAQSSKQATVVHKVFAGTATRYRLRLPTGSVVESHFPSHFDYQVGDTVGIRVAADHLIVFPRESA